MKNLRIVFMGTPEFAVASLKKLVEANKNIIGVVTAPDKPKGRGKKLGKSAVKEYAEEANLNILQPTNLKSPEFLEALKNLNADLQIVVAFRMLPESVWNMPPLGTFNLHGSLLPQYRGAAPINWAIINGEEETGVTTFFLRHEIDTGNIIFQDKEKIEEKDTVGDVYIRLMHKGAALVLQTVNAIENNEVQPQPQLHPQDLKSAPKIFREDCEISWDESSTNIYNKIRGLSPYPAAWTHLGDLTLKIFFAEKTENSSTKEPGTFESDGKTYIYVHTADSILSLTDIQLEGKKRMRTEDFLRGYSWNEKH